MQTLINTLPGAPEWLADAEDKLYRLEAEGERIRAAHRALDEERAEIGAQINLQQKELARLTETARLIGTRVEAGIQHMAERNAREIETCNQRIARLNERMADANRRQQQLSEESRPLLRLLEGCRKALKAVTPSYI